MSLLFVMKLWTRDCETVTGKEWRWSCAADWGGSFERFAWKCSFGTFSHFHSVQFCFFPDYLPQILETVIKGCLDPNIPFNVREKLTPHVTAVLHDFIKAYPTITFHAATQKLCIGTAVSQSAPFVSELTPVPPGFIIIWDLRTATKIQVFDAHSPCNVTALSFNKVSNKPGLLSTLQGDLLLASYSIDNDTVRFWNQSSGILGAIGSSITTSFPSTLSSHQTSMNNRGSNRSVDGESGFLAHLASGGQLKVFCSFTIDHVTGQAIAVEDNGSSASSPNTRRGSISANRILQHVKFEWETDRNFILVRADSSLKFKVFHFELPISIKAMSSLYICIATWTARYIKFQQMIMKNLNSFRLH